MADVSRFFQFLSKENPGDTRDTKWDLFELIPVVILAAIALFAVGCFVWGITTLANTNPFFSSETWVPLGIAVQWATIETAALLLGSLLVCWWQLQQWTGEMIADTPASVASAHVLRIWTMTRALQVGFVCVIAGTIASVVADFGEGFAPNFTAQDWGQAILRIMYAMGVSLISALGLIIADKILYIYPADDESTTDGDSASRIDM